MASRCFPLCALDAGEHLVGDPVQRPQFVRGQDVDEQVQHLADVSGCRVRQVGVAGVGQDRLRVPPVVRVGLADYPSEEAMMGLCLSFARDQNPS